MPLAVGHDLRPNAVGTIVRPIWILSNPGLPYKLISEPRQMEGDPCISAVLLLGFAGKFYSTLHQVAQGLSLHHLVNPLSDVPRLSLLEVLCQIILAQRMPAPRNQCAAAVTEQDPDDWARCCHPRVGILQGSLIGRDAEFQGLSKRVIFAEEPEC